MSAEPWTLVVEPMPLLWKAQEGRSTREDVVARVWPRVRPFDVGVEVLAHDVATFAVQSGSGSRRQCTAGTGELPSAMELHPAQRENMSRQNRHDVRL